MTTTRPATTTARQASRGPAGDPGAGGPLGVDQAALDPSTAWSLLAGRRDDRRLARCTPCCG